MKSAQSLYLVAVSAVKVKRFSEFESLKVYCCRDMVSYKCAAASSQDAAALHNRMSQVLAVDRE